ncbi:MAG: imidazole glycerol phosphate synthase subunit HisF [Desulfovibrio sp.]|nr:imidazole glycerol phosphate synthase subunit HisF [Desulfovibrio sp.]
MLSRRVIVCLDARDGRLTKGVKFAGNKDIGDLAESARRYFEEGADEIVFYDITASAENRGLFLESVVEAAKNIFIPFSVGGGVRSVDDMRQALLAGAEKVSVNSAAVKNPAIIAEGARAFGSQAIVLGMDVLKTGANEKIPSGYEVVINGGRIRTGVDAVEWAKKGEELGAGEICLNSIDADGTKDGYELNITRAVSDATTVPVIASGGAGKPEHLRAVLDEGGASAALVASIVHYGEYTLRQCKEYLSGHGIKTRLVW